MFGKFATVIGPLLYSMFYMLTDRASVGFLSLLILFGSGGILLITGRKELAKTEKEMHEANARMAAEEAEANDLKDKASIGSIKHFTGAATSKCSAGVLKQLRLFNAGYTID